MHTCVLHSIVCIAACHSATRALHYAAQCCVLLPVTLRHAALCVLCPVALRHVHCGVLRSVARVASCHTVTHVLHCVAQCCVCCVLLLCNVCVLLHCDACTAALHCVVQRCACRALPLRDTCAAPRCAALCIASCLAATGPLHCVVQRCVQCVLSHCNTCAAPQGSVASSASVTMRCVGCTVVHSVVHLHTLLSLHLSSPVHLHTSRNPGYCLPLTATPGDAILMVKIPTNAICHSIPACVGLHSCPGPHTVRHSSTLYLAGFSTAGTF